MLLKKKGELVSNGKQLDAITNKFLINISKSSLPVDRKDILKKNIFHLSMIRLEKPMKAKSFLSNIYQRNLSGKLFLVLMVLKPRLREIFLQTSVKLNWIYISH